MTVAHVENHPRNPAACVERATHLPQALAERRAIWPPIGHPNSTFWMSFPIVCRSASGNSRIQSRTGLRPAAFTQNRAGNFFVRSIIQAKCAIFGTFLQHLYGRGSGAILQQNYAKGSKKTRSPLRAFLAKEKHSQFSYATLVTQFLSFGPRGWPKTSESLCPVTRVQQSRRVPNATAVYGI